MKTKNIFKYVMALGALVLILNACKKKEATPPTPPDNDTSGAADNAFAEATFNDVSNISDQGAAGTLSYLSTNNSTTEERGILSACATLHFDTTGTATHTITVDFGPSLCLCSDGRSRSGIITISFHGHYHDIGSTVTVTFSNYNVNGNVVAGTHTIVYNGLNTNNHPNYTIDVNGTITKANNGGVITWVSHRTREWTEGYTTNSGMGHYLDDVYSISGTAHGTHSNGNSFTETATNLKVHLNCRWVESGQLNITPAGHATRYIDFGAEACNADATVTINGTAYNFTMQ
jgi:hypothetical protein